MVDIFVIKFIYKKHKEIIAVFITVIILAGALASAGGGDAQEPTMVDLKPQILKITQDKIQQKHSHLSKDDAKIFAALKEKGMEGYYVDYLIRFFNINKKYSLELKELKELKDLLVFNKDINFYRILKNKNILPVNVLNKMAKNKPMTPYEKKVLYTMAKDNEKYLKNNAFGFRKPYEKEIYLPNELLKFLVFNEKFKIDNNLEISAIKKFLDKNNITWGETDKLKELMNNYNDLLESYIKR